MGGRVNDELLRIYTQLAALMANDNALLTGDGWIPFTALAFSRETAKDVSTADQFCLSLAGNQTSLFDLESKFKWTNNSVVKYAILKDYEYVSGDGKTYFFFFTGDDTSGVPYSLDASGAVSAVSYSRDRMPAGFILNLEKWKRQVTSSANTQVSATGLTTVLTKTLGRGLYRFQINGNTGYAATTNGTNDWNISLLNSTDSTTKLILKYYFSESLNMNSQVILPFYQTEFVQNVATGGATGVKTYQLNLNVVAITSFISVRGDVGQFVNMEFYGLI